MSVKRSPGRVTLHDVAREAGVSVATASRVLNGGDRKVSDDLTARVRQAAARLRYAPDLSARAVKRGTSSTIGLIVSDISDPYFAAVASGVIGAAKLARMTVTIAATERSAQLELETVRAMRAQGHRSIILVGSRPVRQPELDLIAELQRFEQAGGTVVFVSQPALPFSTVTLDNVGGARSLALKLVGHGYRSFAVLAGDRRFATVEDRISGFVEGLGQVGVAMSDERIFAGSFSRDGGFETARAFIESGLQSVDLVFATSDVMALGAMAAFRDHGVRVGSDVGLAGFDDIRVARLVTPGLTTVAAPMTEMGTAAVELALSEAGERVIREFSTTIALRESSPRRVR